MIPIHRRPLPAALGNRMTTLTGQIRATACADVCQAMLRQVQQPGAATVFADVPDIVDLLRDQDLRKALLVAALLPDEL